LLYRSGLWFRLGGTALLKTPSLVHRHPRYTIVVDLCWLLCPMFVGYITNLIPSNSRSTALNFDH
jgi:hypothetical protein